LTYSHTGRSHADPRSEGDNAVFDRDPLRARLNSLKAVLSLEVDDLRVERGSDSHSHVSLQRDVLGLLRLNHQKKHCGLNQSGPVRALTLDNSSRPNEMAIDVHVAFKDDTDHPLGMLMTWYVAPWQISHYGGCTVPQSKIAKADASGGVRLIFELSKRQFADVHDSFRHAPP
jgi:hypothetical protein